MSGYNRRNTEWTLSEDLEQPEKLAADTVRVQYILPILFLS